MRGVVCMDCFFANGIEMPLQTINSMSSLFSLPDDVCIALYALWIDIEDLAVFDTSICNTTDRNPFLDLIRSPSFVQNTLRMYTSSLYFNWLARREIKANNLNLMQYGRKKLSPTIRKIISCSKHYIRHLQMEYCSNLVHLLDGVSFTIEKLSLVDSDTLNDEKFAILMSKMKELTAIDISECADLTDDCCNAIILNCHKMVRIDIRNCDAMTSQAITKIAQNYNKQIQKLSLNRAVTDVELCQIAQFCPNLTFLDANGCNLVTDEGVSKLAECCIKLKHVFLSSIQITDKSIMKLARHCSHLQELLLDSCDITDISLFELSKLCDLKNELNFCICPKITDIGVCAMIGNYSVLTTIVLDLCPLVTDVTVECIANNCSNLESISLVNCTNVTDTALLTLISKCDQLLEYCFSGTKSTANVYNQIAHNCDYIRMIGDEPYFSEIVFSESRFEINKQRRRNGGSGLICKFTVFPFSMPTIKTCGDNNWFAKLTEFRIDFVVGIDDDMINSLTLCCPLLHTVYIVNLNSCDVTYHSFQYISERLSHLHSLQMDEILGITDEMVLQFLTLHGCNMRVLGLFQCGDLLTDQMIYAISEYCSECLVELNVCGLTTITNNAVNTIIYTCKKLTKLNISNCILLTNQILFEISQHCEYLQELNISDCAEIDHDSIVEFLMYYRQLNVLIHSDGVRVENV